MEKVKTKDIIIIGGGITGLSLLHFLSQKYKGRHDVTINLFEKNAQLGGTIHTIERANALFETGPNGFLDNQEATFRLIQELSLEKDVVAANEEAALRFISLNHKLYPLPSDPKTFLTSNLFSLTDKIRIFGEMSVKPKNNDAESVYDFAKRRFGRKFADYVADPFINGVYAGDARNISVRAAFPQLKQWEAQYGSILKAFKARKKERGKGAPKFEAPQLKSFKKGMGQLVDRIHERYAPQVHAKEMVLKVFHREDRYVITTDKNTYKADELFMCTPAYVTSQIIRSLDADIADDLTYFSYAPVVVLGLLVPENIFEKKPAGFGYLVPSSQKKEILGALFESNIFSNRVPKDHLLMRIMLGGARHPDICHRSKKELIECAIKELEATFPTRGATSLTKIDLHKMIKETFYVTWEKAIPQYDQINTEMNPQIDRKLKRFRDLYLLGNYRAGVSFNDCIENASRSAAQSSL